MKFGILAFVALLWVTPALAGPAEDEAAAAAKTWLALIDAKNYAQSYKDAADIFHEGISEAKWEEMVRSGRGKAGALKSRAIQAAELTKTLPGVPDGDYANVSFQADFETKGPSTEIVTLVHENGKWKVGGYHIN
jgi:hypothetical protein